MLVRHRSGVTKEGSRNITGMLAGQFSCPAGPQVLEELGPGLYASTFNDPQELGSQIRVAIVVTRDDVFRSSVSLVKHRL